MFWCKLRGGVAYFEQDLGNAWRFMKLHKNVLVSPAPFPTNLPDLKSWLIDVIQVLFGPHCPAEQPVLSLPVFTHKYMWTVSYVVLRMTII